jgi:hypothetical protein
MSVARAVDVAKDAADIVLLDRSLTVLHEGIIEMVYLGLVEVVKRRLLRPE